MKFATLPGNLAFKAAVDSIRTKERVVVIGGEEARVFVEEQIEQSGAEPAAILQAAQRISACDWLKKGIDKFIKKAAVEMGNWPTKSRPKKHWSLDRDRLANEIRKEAVVAKMSVEGSWQIPAMLCFGGGNDCPPPEVHCAVWKYWQGKFDAHVVGVSHDVIEAIVFSPPTSREQGLRLAKQQYAYCGDIVSQGVGSIASLAAGLVNADKWFFWWD